MGFRHILMFVSLAVTLRGQDLSVLDSLVAVLHQPGGVRLEFTVYQQQGAERWLDYGTLEVYGPDRFRFQTSDQDIQVIRDTVFTYNYQTRQLIIDRVYREEFNLFDVLTGDFRHVQVVAIQADGETITITFNIIGMDWHGTLIVHSVSYQPVELVLRADDEASVRVRIEAFAALSGRESSGLSDPDRAGWEVIDFRE
jgi:hypothetical protein